MAHSAPVGNKALRHLTDALGLDPTELIRTIALGEAFPTLDFSRSLEADFVSIKDFRCTIDSGNSSVEQSLSFWETTNWSAITYRGIDDTSFVLEDEDVAIVTRVSLTVEGTALASDGSGLIYLDDGSFVQLLAEFDAEVTGGTNEGMAKRADGGIALPWYFPRPDFQNAGLRVRTNNNDSPTARAFDFIFRVLEAPPGVFSLVP